MSKKLLIAVVAVGVSLGLSQSALAVQPIFGPPKPEKKIVICHATNSASNPYQQIEVNQSAADGGYGNGDHYNEHDYHRVPTSEAEAQDFKAMHKKWGDIIPPIPGKHNGLNWTAQGQAIYNNDCNYVTGGSGGGPTDPTDPTDPVEPETPVVVAAAPVVAPAKAMVAAGGANTTKTLTTTLGLIVSVSALGYGALKLRKI